MAPAKALAQWSPDFGRLYEFAGGDRVDVGRAVLYGSRPPKNDSLWEIARRRRFEGVVHDRNRSNKEKKIDTSIATVIVADAYELMKPTDEVTLVSGDADFVPIIERLKKRGIPLHVVFWDHAARELKQVASEFVSLNRHLHYLRAKK